MSDEEYRRLQDKIEFDKNSLTTGGPTAIICMGVLLAIIVCIIVIAYFS